MNRAAWARTLVAFLLLAFFSTLFGALASYEPAPSFTVECDDRYEVCDF